MKQISVVCPHCQKTISLDDVMAHQIEQDVNQQALVKLEQEKAKWEKEQKEMLWKVAKQKAEEKISLQKDQELKLLQEENAQKDQALKEARQMELNLRKAQNALEDEKKAFELEKQRQLDEEREKIRRTAEESFLEKHRLIEAEQEKRISGMKKTIEELQLKANQGSQQTQGEVLELEIEEALKREFPIDEIIPVAKGINGADIIQKVHDSSGRVCGSIVWESKRTKNWSDGWVEKLKDDLMRAKGDVSVLISIALPEGIRNFGFKDGVYVASFESYIALAYVLRKALIDQQSIKVAVVGKNEKMEMVYNYFLSSEFKQRITAIAEAFSQMRSDLDTEKKVFAKLWSKREKEIERVVHNTAAMHGDLQGLMGASLPVIESLEPEALLLGFESELPEPKEQL